MSFTISLDHDTFEAGSVLTGAVFLTNEKQMSAEELRITFRGEERTRVIDKESKQASEAVGSLHMHREVLRGLVESGEISAGNYTIPFMIPIPDNLPQTITIPWTHVTYYVGFELEDREGRTVEQVSSKVNILAKRVPHAPTPHRCEPFMEYVKKSRFKKGHFVVTMDVKDSVMEPGEQVGVSVAIRNRSPVQILKVKVLVKQAIHATAVNKEREVERVIAFHEFKEYRKTKRKRSKWLRGTDPLEDFEEIQQELESSEHEGTLRIPKNATLTYRGNLFDVKHDLYIQVQTDMKDPVDIHILPIVVCRKEPVLVEIDNHSNASSEYEYPSTNDDNVIILA